MHTHTHTQEHCLSDYNICRCTEYIKKKKKNSECVLMELYSYKVTTFDVKWNNIYINWTVVS